MNWGAGDFFSDSPTPRLSDSSACCLDDYFPGMALGHCLLRRLFPQGGSNLVEQHDHRVALQAFHDVAFAGKNGEVGGDAESVERFVSPLRPVDPGAVFLLAHEQVDAHALKTSEVFEVAVSGWIAGKGDHAVEAFRIIEGDPEGAPTAVATAADVEFAALDVVLTFEVVEQGRM